MVQEINTGQIVPDQMVRLCRKCNIDERHYRITDPVLEEEGFLTAEYQCMGCMQVRSVIVDSINNEENIDNNPHIKYNNGKRKRVTKTF
jgi:hypothetical protein